VDQFKKTSVYASRDYLYKGRWISYWHQIMEASSFADVHRILEIGPGNQIVANTLKQMGYEVKTMDADEHVPADYHWDIRTLKNWPDKDEFDVVLCCQILEHVPFENVKNILEDLAEISKKYLVVSLPYSEKGTFKPFMYFKLIPFIRSFRFIKVFSVFPYKRTSVSSSGHYWEIGEKGRSLKRVRALFEESGWKMKKHYPVFENSYHYMFVLEKKDSKV